MSSGWVNMPRKRLKGLDEMPSNRRGVQWRSPSPGGQRAKQAATVAAVLYGVAGAFVLTVLLADIGPGGVRTVAAESSDRLWRRLLGVAPIPTRVGQVPVVLSGPAPRQACVIKGNVSSSGERIYHVPGQRHYGATRISVAKGERWFCSEAEARRAGWRRART